MGDGEAALGGDGAEAGAAALSNACDRETDLQVPLLHIVAVVAQVEGGAAGPAAHRLVEGGDVGGAVVVAALVADCGRLLGGDGGFFDLVVHGKILLSLQLGEAALDGADQRPLPADLAEELRPLFRQVGVEILLAVGVAQYVLDLRDGEAAPAQQGDLFRPVQVLFTVEPVAPLAAGAGGEQALLVVVAQGLDSEGRQLGKFSDLVHEHHLLRIPYTLRRRGESREKFHADEREKGSGEIASPLPQKSYCRRS